MLATASRQGWRRHHFHQVQASFGFLRDLHNGKRKGQKNSKEWLFSECLLGVVLVYDRDTNSAAAAAAATTAAAAAAATTAAAAAAAAAATGEDNDDEARRSF
jgi:hypothetical protein